METKLPGVGVRYDFVTAEGRRVGVINHRSGYQDLLVFDGEDPDRCLQTVRLEESDSRALTEILGASPVTRTLAEEMQQSIEGLTIDWVPIRRASAANGLAIADTQLRSRTGVTIVALVRGQATIPAPDPSLRLQDGDIAVVVGTAEGIHEAVALLQG